MPVTVRLLATRLAKPSRKGATIALCVSAALLGSAATARWRLQSALDAEARVHRALAERVRAAQRSVSAASAPEPDFVQRLPTALSIDAVAQRFHESATEFGVALVSANADPQHQTVHTLERWNVTIVLRGSYAALKRTLSEALSRYPEAVVEALKIRRDPSGSANLELEVRMVFPLRFHP